MAEKKVTSRKSTSKKVITEKVEKSILKDLNLIPNKTYMIELINVEGAEKGTKKKVSGVVAQQLIKTNRAKLIE